MSSSIVIPKFDATATLPGVTPAVIPPEAITAPDAPMSDAPQTAQAVPSTDVNFLDAVRESNVKRSGVEKVPPTGESAPAAPATGEAKPDTVPPVFKKLGETEKPADPAPKDDAPVDGEDVKPPSDKEMNIKQLKSHLNTATAREAQLRQRNEELQTQLDQLKEFESKIEEHERLKERVQHLEGYEKILDIHSNPEFQAKYIEGAENLSAEAKAMAAQYGITDPTVIDQAVKIRNRKDLNDFFVKQGLDGIGISDIRPYVLQLQQLDDERIQLEKSPEEARETLTAMYRENEKRRVETVSKSIKEKTATAFQQTLGYYSRGETAVDLFVEKPGDPEHTERRRGVLNRANEEFAKVMGAFTGLGIREMPAAIVQTMAARFQLSEGFGELQQMYEAEKSRADALEKQLRETTSYTRPPIGAGSRNGAPSSTDIPNGTSVAAHVFQTAQSKVNAQQQR